MDTRRCLSVWTWTLFLSTMFQESSDTFYELLAYFELPKDIFLVAGILIIALKQLTSVWLQMAKMETNYNLKNLG